MVRIIDLFTNLVVLHSPVHWPVH